MDVYIYTCNPHTLLPELHPHPLSPRKETFITLAVLLETAGIKYFSAQYKLSY